MGGHSRQGAGELGRESEPSTCGARLSRHSHAFGPEHLPRCTTFASLHTPPLLLTEHAQSHTQNSCKHAYPSHMQVYANIHIHEHPHTHERHTHIHGHPTHTPASVLTSSVRRQAQACPHANTHTHSTQSIAERRIKEATGGVKRPAEGSEEQEATRW